MTRETLYTSRWPFSVHGRMIQESVPRANLLAIAFLDRQTVPLHRSMPARDIYALESSWTTVSCPHRMNPPLCCRTIGGHASYCILDEREGWTRARGRRGDTPAVCVESFLYWSWTAVRVSVPWLSNSSLPLTRHLDITFLGLLPALNFCLQSPPLHAPGGVTRSRCLLPRPFPRKTTLQKRPPVLVSTSSFNEPRRLPKENISPVSVRGILTMGMYVCCRFESGALLVRRRRMAPDSWSDWTEHVPVIRLRSRRRYTSSSHSSVFSPPNTSFRNAARMVVKLLPPSQALPPSPLHTSWENKKRLPETLSVYDLTRNMSLFGFSSTVIDLASPASRIPGTTPPSLPTSILPTSAAQACLPSPSIEPTHGRHLVVGGRSLSHFRVVFLGPDEPSRLHILHSEVASTVDGSASGTAGTFAGVGPADTPAYGSPASSPSLYLFRFPARPRRLSTRPPSGLGKRDASEGNAAVGRRSALAAANAMDNVIGDDADNVEIQMGNFAICWRRRQATPAAIRSQNRAS
ncbi:hypothetical protein C8F01DRAFT_1245310 [Mycena amicta]|nr:hypothetical protein C8F01DRAFT_1245310 [Mycena amicta]